MLEIDATHGGQVLRVSLGLSAMLERDIKLTNIRASRPNPGLQQQHLAAVRTLRHFCNATVKGDVKGARELSFIPKKYAGGSINVNIGTAGSSLLLVQSLLLPSILKKTKARIAGGTDVPFAPTFAHAENVLLPLLKGMNAKFELSLFSHGFYPKGNGSISFSSQPAKLPLKRICMKEQGSIESIEIFSQSCSLPKEVAITQAASARKALQAFANVDVLENLSSAGTSSSTGSSIDIICRTSKGCHLGVNALGARGKPAAAVGKEAADAMISVLKSGAAVDNHSSDQLIPFMAMAKGRNEISVREITEHCKTCIGVAETFFGKRFEIIQEGELSTILCEGVSYQ